MATRQEQAVNLHKAGRLDEAAAIYAELLNANPNNYHSMQLLGVVEFQRGDCDRAIALISRALEMKPDTASYHHNIAAAYRVLGQFEAAEEHYRTALRLKPDYAEAYFNLAGVLKFTPDDPLREALEELLKRPGWSTQDQCYLRFAAGKMYDDFQMYDRAFAHYEQGNAVHGGQFDCEQYARFADGLIATFDRAMLHRRASIGFADPAPVFVIGMPRSGTTLVEQILASHPKVHGAGELVDMMSIAEMLRREASGSAYPNCVRTIADEVYRVYGEAQVRRLHSFNPTAERIVDKLPRNFENLGLISLMFPQARIIHCRRGPLDTCLSCYFQKFTSGHEWSYDMSHIASYFRTYLRLMEHWRAALPCSIFELDYEDLIENQKAVIREMIGFCGLDWDEACLQFHQTERPVSTASSWQVRQPVYSTAIRRWQNYADHIEPLREALENNE